MTHLRAPRGRWDSACGPARNESCAGSVRIRFQKSGDEFRRIEYPEVLGLLAHADEADGDLQALRDGKDHAAFRRPIEFRDHESGYAQSLVELLRLRDRILADGAVEHQKQFVGG